jgi:hypothetical protein
VTVNVTTEQRRALLGVRHHLARPAATAEEVAHALVGMHATDPATVYLSFRARMQAPEIKDIESALYEERSLARILGMRRTVWVVPVGTVPVIHAGCTRAIAVVERRKLVQLLEEAGITKGEDTVRWLRRVEDATVEALKDMKEATAAELSAVVPELREQMAMGQGKKWEGKIGVGTRVLFLLATDERIVRGRPLGSWTSTQYRWSPIDAWLPEDGPEPTPEAARTELARRWLHAFGPAPVDDLKWWTGWTAAQTKQALAALAPIDVDLEGRPAIMLPDDRPPAKKPRPWAALLPALDPTVMGWSQRSWFLGDHKAALFDRSGNAGPTVWWNGRIIGGWAQRKDGEIAVRLLEDVGADAARAVDKEAERLQAWLGRARVTPRFRIPLERELVQ